MELHYIVYLVNGKGVRVGSVPAYSDPEVLTAVADLLEGTLDMEHTIEIVRTK
jgi:hypothetical protein